MATEARTRLNQLRKRQGELPGPDARSALEGLRQAQGPLQPGGTALQAAARGGVDQFLNNFLEVPAIIGRLARATPGVRLLAQPLFDAGEAVSPGPVTPAGLRAGIQTIPGLLADDPQSFGELKAAEQALTAQLGQEFPPATLLGSIAGDAATIATGRAPIARFLPRTAPAASASSLAPGARRLGDRILKSKAVKTVADRAGRSVETGLEGATLAILNGNDPLETAAYGAGGQALGSLALGFTGSKKGLIGLAATAAGTTALLQLLKSATPGGSDSIIESSESAFNKLLFGLIVGGISGLAGAGRIRGEFAKDLPRIADAITAIPRGAALSVLNRVLAGDEDVEPVLGALSRDPTVFSPDARNKLERALTTANGDIGATINNLKRDPSFRRRLSAIKNNRIPGLLE